jgi:HEAT repeat protein
MKRCDDVLEAWSSHLAGDPEPLSPELREHLLSCPRCSAEKDELERLWRRLDGLADEAPSGELRDRFAATLLAYRETLTAAAAAAAETGGATTALPFRPQVRRRTTVRVARLGWIAAALLGGVGLGMLARPGGNRQEVLELRREVGDLREVLALSLLQQGSASARLEGVSVGATIAERNPVVLAALFDTLAADPNPNVRLAAVDALAPRADEPAVQKKLGEALRKEGEPLVQIALADALLSARDARARRLVEPLADDDAVREEVRQYVSQRLGRGHKT